MNRKIVVIIILILVWYYLKYIKTKKKNVIKNIEFENNSYILTENSKKELDKFVLFLNKKLEKYRLIGVSLTGHTDNIGTEEYNQKLSEQRAKSVEEYLISKGISDYSILTNGKGESEPIATNETEEGRAKNRRVEYEFIIPV
jgi:outer membrane protein OmpA-like peptidoglycan-associated protein